MQIPILNGIYVDTNAELRSSYPRNLIPVPKDNGISQGYLRPAEGLQLYTLCSGIDRGGINWKGILYRVIGSKLVSVGQNESITVLGDVGYAPYPVSLAYSFDNLAICSNNNLFYFDGSNLKQVSDIDLGQAVDAIWVDGYFMVTDGVSIIVTDLADPFAINPLKYGSAEADPDPIQCMLKLRNAPYIVGRYTIEMLTNVGGSLFPFRRVEGAEIMRGSIGRKSACVFMEQLAFLGSGRNEPSAVYLADNGSSVKVSTYEVDTILSGYSESDLAKTVVEPRISKSHAFLYVHLPDRSLVYDYNASLAVKEPIWFILDSGIAEHSKYQARFFVWCYGKWIFGDPTAPRLGTFTLGSSKHYGVNVAWEFNTTILYNKGNGIIIHELELMALTGVIDKADKPTVTTSYSTDGVTWSNERPRTVGLMGNRSTRINWLQQGNMRNWRIQKFKGNSAAFISLIALEARIEPLND